MSTKIIDSLTLSCNLEVLREKYRETSGQRDLAVDPVPFDKLTLQMSQIERLITLNQNKLRMQQKAEEEAARAASLERHQAELWKIGVFKAELADQGQVLFTALETFYTQIQESLKTVHTLHKLTERASAEAKRLNVDPVELSSVTWLGVTWQKPLEEIANDLIQVFSLQYWQTQDALKSGMKLAGVPSVESISKYGRIFDWSEWLVKPEPPPEPDTPAEDGRTPEPE